ncbi:MAG: DMT family transporter [Chloroflexota bacterium]
MPYVRTRNIPPWLVLAGGILAVSTASIFIRHAQASAPSIVIAAWRLTLATIILTPIALTRRQGELRRLTRRDLLLALLSGLFLALHFAAWITSLEYTSIASSVVLVTTTPLWVSLASPILLRERVSRWTWVGMGVALLGGTVVGLSDAGSAGATGGKNLLFGDLLALFGAWMAACYVIIGRRLRAGVSLVGYTFLVYGMAAFGLLALLLVAGQPLFGYAPQTYLWFLLLALIPQLLGHSAFNWALRYLSAAFTATALLGEPVGSIVLAYFFLSEAPGAIQLGGAALILAGIAVAGKRET